ncbi:MAG: nucleotidyltransferase domain-containing protein [bacterium]
MPSDLKPVVAALVARVTAVLAEHPLRTFLASAYVFGSALGPRYRPESSDFDVQLVLEDTEEPRAALIAIQELGHDLVALGALDVNAAFVSEALRKVPSRAFIYNEIAIRGRLIYGRDTLPRDRALAWRDLADEVIFDAREYRRIYLGTRDPVWRALLAKRAPLLFLQLALLLDTVTEDIDEAIALLVTRFPTLRPHTAAFEAACHEPGERALLEALLVTYEVLRDFCEQQAASEGNG